MSLISKADFTSHIYDGVINAISNDDDTKLDTAILAATTQAFGYLSRFDTEAINNATAEEKPKYAALILYIKDIAKWHFIAVCNVNIDLALAERRYEFAVAELLKIQQGKTTPKGWALVNPETPATSFSITSRPKRGNYI